MAFDLDKEMGFNEQNSVNTNTGFDLNTEMKTSSKTTGFDLDAAMNNTVTPVQNSTPLQQPVINQPVLNNAQQNPPVMYSAPMKNTSIGLPTYKSDANSLLDAKSRQQAMNGLSSNEPVPFDNNYVKYQHKSLLNKFTGITPEQSMLLGKYANSEPLTYEEIQKQVINGKITKEQALALSKERNDYDNAMADNQFGKEFRGEVGKAAIKAALLYATMMYGAPIAAAAIRPLGNVGTLAGANLIAKGLNSPVGQKIIASPAALNTAKFLGSKYVQPVAQGFGNFVKAAPTVAIDSAAFAGAEHGINNLLGYGNENSLGQTFNEYNNFGQAINAGLNTLGAGGKLIARTPLGTKTGEFIGNAINNNETLAYLTAQLEKALGNQFESNIPKVNAYKALDDLISNNNAPAYLKMNRGDIENISKVDNSFNKNEDRYFMQKVLNEEAIKPIKYNKNSSVEELQEALDNVNIQYSKLIDLAKDKRISENAINFAHKRATELQKTMYEIQNRINDLKNGSNGNTYYGYLSKFEDTEPVTYNSLDQHIFPKYSKIEEVSDNTKNSVAYKSYEQNKNILDDATKQRQEAYNRFENAKQDRQFTLNNARQTKEDIQKRIAELQKQERDSFGDIDNSEEINKLQKQLHEASKDVTRSHYLTKINTYIAEQNASQAKASENIAKSAVVNDRKDVNILTGKKTTRKETPILENQGDSVNTKWHKTQLESGEAEGANPNSSRYKEVYNENNKRLIDTEHEKISGALRKSEDSVKPEDFPVNKELEARNKKIQENDENLRDDYKYNDEDFVVDKDDINFADYDNPIKKDITSEEYIESSADEVAKNRNSRFSNKDDIIWYGKYDNLNSKRQKIKALSKKLDSFKYKEDRDKFLKEFMQTREDAFNKTRPVKIGDERQNFAMQDEDLDIVSEVLNKNAKFSKQNIDNYIDNIPNLSESKRDALKRNMLLKEQRENFATKDITRRYGSITQKEQEKIISTLGIEVKPGMSLEHNLINSFEKDKEKFMSMSGNIDKNKFQLYISQKARAIMHGNNKTSRVRSISYDALKRSAEQYAAENGFKVKVPTEENFMDKLLNKIHKSINGSLTKKENQELVDSVGSIGQWLHNNKDILKRLGWYYNDRRIEEAYSKIADTRIKQINDFIKDGELEKAEQIFRDNEPLLKNYFKDFKSKNYITDRDGNLKNVDVWDRTTSDLNDYKEWDKFKEDLRRKGLRNLDYEQNVGSGLKDRLEFKNEEEYNKYLSQQEENRKNRIADWEQNHHIPNKEPKYGLGKGEQNEFENIVQTTDSSERVHFNKLDRNDNTPHSIADYINDHIYNQNMSEHEQYVYKTLLGDTKFSFDETLTGANAQIVGDVVALSKDAEIGELSHEGLHLAKDAIYEEYKALKNSGIFKQLPKDERDAIDKIAKEVYNTRKVNNEINKFQEPDANMQKVYGMSADEIRNHFIEQVRAYTSKQQNSRYTSGNSLFDRDSWATIDNYYNDVGEKEAGEAFKNGLGSTEFSELIKKGLFDGLIRKLQQRRNTGNGGQVFDIESRGTIQSLRRSSEEQTTTRSIYGSQQRANQPNDGQTSSEVRNKEVNHYNSLDTSSTEKLVRRITGMHSKDGKIDTHKVYKAVKDIRKVSKAGEDIAIQEGWIGDVQAAKRLEHQSGRYNTGSYVRAGYKNKNNELLDYLKGDDDSIGLFGGVLSGKYDRKNASASATMLNTLADYHRRSSAQELAHFITDEMSIPIPKNGSDVRGYVKVNPKLLSAAIYGRKSREWFDAVQGGVESITKTFKNEKEQQLLSDLYNRTKGGEVLVPDKVLLQSFDGSGEKLNQYWKNYGKDKPINAIIKGLGVATDFVNDQFKRGVLTSGSFVVNNRLGNQSMLLGQSKNPIEYLQSWVHAATTKDSEYPARLTENLLAEAFGNFNRAKKYTGVTAVDNMLNLMGGHVIDTKHLTGVKDIAAKTANACVGLPNKAYNALAEKVMKFNQSFENFERKQAAFIARRRMSESKIKSIKQCGQAMQSTEAFSKHLEENPELMTVFINNVEDILGNYSTFNNIEKRVFKRFIPFYSWLRTITRNTASMAKKYPHRFALIEMAKERYKENTDKNLQDFQRYAIPTSIRDSRNGKNLLVNKEEYIVPWETLGKIGKGENPLSSFTKAITVPQEAIQGRKNFAPASEINNRRYIRAKSKTGEYIYYDTKTGRFRESLPISTRAGYVAKELGAKTVYPVLGSPLIKADSLIEGVKHYKETGEFLEPDKTYDADFGGFYNNEFRTKKHGIKVERNAKNNLSEGAKIANRFGASLQTPIKKSKKQKQFEKRQKAHKRMLNKE